MHKTLLLLALLISTTACSSSSEKAADAANTSRPSVNSASQDSAKPPIETVEFRLLPTKLIVMNTNGRTEIKYTPDLEVATLDIEKIKTSEICEIKHQLKGSTLHVNVRNRGFTGGGDCDINLKLAVPAVTEMTIISINGPVALHLPKALAPKLTFETKSGKMTGNFKNNPSGKPRISVHTQSGHLAIKSL